MCAAPRAARAIGAALARDRRFRDLFTAHHRARHPSGAGRGRRPLFPAYTFIWIVDHWWSAMRSPGVIRPDHEWSIARRAFPTASSTSYADANRPDGLIRLPEPRGLQRGDKVLIRDGPFTNLVAVYAGMSGHQRVAVLLALFGGEKRVTLPKDDIIAL